ncbi:MAG: SDR family NAD(P)-dependent oxidoreductase [Pseudomonadota bacterium]
MSSTVIILGGGSLKGVGGALAQRFANEGHHVVFTGRTLETVQATADAIAGEGGSIEAMRVDVTSEADQDTLFAHAAERGEIAAVLYNAGNNAIIPFEQLTAKQFENFWRVCCFGAFLTSQRAVPLLKEQGHGSMFFTGASGSLRGKPNFAHFASAKAGLRNLLQSLAREYGPQGIHVAHFIIDGVIDGDRVRDNYPDYLDQMGEDGALSPAAIADAFCTTHKQHRSAWSHEVELRPFKERW